VIESPADSFEKSGNVSSQEAGVSSEAGEALHLYSSVVQITEVSQSPPVSASTVVMTFVPIIPTPDQPQPMCGSSRIQGTGMANVPVLDKVVQAVKQRDLEGNSSFLSHNSFFVLQDDDIISKALEIGIDISSLPMKTVHLLKDLESARKTWLEKLQIILNLLVYLLNLLLVCIIVITTHNLLVVLSQ
jgi:hypothetical protein